MKSGICLGIMMPLLRSLLLFCCWARPVVCQQRGPVVRFHNEGKQSLQLRFVERGVQRTLATIPPGTFHPENTYWDHVFELSEDESRGPSRTPARPAKVTVRGSGEVWCAARRAGVECREFWTDPAEERRRSEAAASSSFQGERWERHVAQLKQVCRAGLARNPEDIEHFCEALDYSTWVPAQCSFELSEEESFRNPELLRNTAASEERNKKQPTQFKKFTAHGHIVASIPKELLGELRTFWLENRLHSAIPENEPRGQAAAPGCQFKTWILDLPSELKRRAVQELQPLVASWAGVDPETLRETAIYGLRLYRDGALLKEHVDLSHTHALSAILEVGRLVHGDSQQEEGQLSWPLEIYDHNGTLHSVPSREGQMILYESATCPHGRWAYPCPGREFANLFVHFAPKSWPEQYRVTSQEEL